jgi:mRNA interferase HigB
VRVISQRTLQEFWARHPDAREPLQEWFKTAGTANWLNLCDVRRVYPHADGVQTRHSGTLTVFNICGNKYRLIVRIRYDWKLVNIRAVLTHAEYDREAWKE